MASMLLQMWGSQRIYIIESHKFYVKQSKARLLPPFINIEAEAEEYANEWLERHSKKHFDPDFDDPAEIYEQSNDKMVNFLLNLDDLHKNVLLSIVAGMYHKWEKELREWLINEMRPWKGYAQLRKKVWHLSFKQIFDLFRDFGWDVYAEPFFLQLDACRVIVNVYKHGNGNSFEELKQNYPQYLIKPSAFTNSNNSIALGYLDHTNVELKEGNIDVFANSITSFWEKIPENIYMENVIKIPEWLKNKI